MKIYYARTDALVKESMFSRALKMLPDSRLEKLSRIKPDTARIQCVAAGILLEIGLRDYSICGKNVTFLKNSDGKPYILEYPNLHYNLSHSGEYVALVMADCAVGIDIEKVRYGQERLVKRFFSKEEAECLLESFSDLAFTKTWTRKEAFIKAKGIGMRMPLAGFSTITDVVKLNEEMPEEMQTEIITYYLNSYQINEEYWISVCQEGYEVTDTPVEIKIENFL